MARRRTWNIGVLPAAVGFVVLVVWAVWRYPGVGDPPEADDGDAPALLAAVGSALILGGAVAAASGACRRTELPIG